MSAGGSGGPVPGGAELGRGRAGDEVWRAHARHHRRVMDLVPLRSDALDSSHQEESGRWMDCR
jgi:hypothetical protein